MTQTVVAHRGGQPARGAHPALGPDELGAGRGADPERAVDLLVRLAAGDGDALSGRHLSVHDDLDALLRRTREITARDLYVLRPEPLPTTSRRSS